MSKTEKSKALVFAVKLIALVLVAFLILFAVNTFYVKGNYYITTYEEVRKFQDVPYGITLANSGTSHGMASFDYRGLEGETTFNFALSGEDIYHDFQTLQQFSDHLSEGCVVAIPTSYFSFCMSLDEPSQKRYYEYMDYDRLKGFSYEILINTKYLPVLRSGEFIFKDLINDQSIDFGAVIQDGQASVTVDTAPSPRTSQASANQAKVNELKSHATGRAEGWRTGYMNVGEKYMADNCQLLIDMINYCKEQGWRPVLITTPIHYTLNEAFEEGELEHYYFSNVRKAQQETGVPYLDLSHDEEFSVAADYYSNSDHLNTTGAAAFMEVYLQFLEEIGYR